MSDIEETSTGRTRRWEIPLVKDIDPTFYRSPSEAINAPPEQLAYVVAFDRAAQQPDALAVLGTDPESPGYGQVAATAG